MPADSPAGTSSRLRRFALVGVVNTAIDFVVFGVLSVAGLPLLAANFISTSAGMTFSFLANRGWAFRSTRSLRRSVVPFLLATATGLWVIQPIVINLVVRILDSPDTDPDLGTLWFAKALAIGVGMVWNFTWYRWVVFPPADPSVPSETHPTVEERAT